jgi:hypothetical protein
MGFRMRHAVLDIPLLTHGEVKCELVVEVAGERGERVREDARSMP